MRRWLTLKSLLHLPRLFSESQQIARLGSWEADYRTGTLWWSDEVYRIFGLDPRKTVPSRTLFYKSVHPDDRERVQTQIDAALAAGRDFSLDHRIVLPDGGERILHERARVTARVDGKAARTAGTVQDVTELRRAEQALAQGEQRFRDIAEAGSDWLWETDADQRFTGIWGNLRDRVGLGPAQLIGRKRFEILTNLGAPADQMARHAADIEARLPFRDLTWDLTALDGRQRRLRVSGSPYFDDQGRFLGYRGTSADITREYQAEQQAKHGQERLLTALDRMTDGVALFDADDRLVVCNQRYREWAGELAPLLVPGMPWLDLVKGWLKSGAISHDMASDEEFLRARLRNHRGGTFVTEMNHVRGRWLLIKESPTADGGILIVATDITDIKEREARLAQLAMIVERTNDAATIIDKDRRIVWVNNGFTRITGYTLDDVVGRRPRDFWDGPDTDPNTIAMIREGLARGEPVEAEIVLYRKDGTPFWAALSSTPVKDERGNVTCYVSIQRDITRQKQDAEALAKALRTAEQANRAKSQFLASVGHELRTPLNTVIGYADLLYREQLGPLGVGGYVEFARSIRESGNHLLGVINDIIEFSRAEAGQLQLKQGKVDLAKLAAEAMRAMLLDADAKGVTLSTVGDQDLPTIRGDAVKLRQVVLNLLANAVRVTPTGGTVSIKLGRTEDGGVALAVVNTGSGMAPNQIETAMAAFEKLEAGGPGAGGGLGLGLDLGRRFVELHGGRVELASSPGSGTSVTVLLPAESVIQPSDGGAGTTVDTPRRQHSTV